MFMRHPTGCGCVSAVSLFIHSYLLDSSTWSKCVEPKHVVEWNVSLFSILLALGGIEFILCLIQVINGMLGGVCGYCSSRQQVRTCVKMHHCFHPRVKRQKLNPAQPLSVYSIFVEKDLQLLGFLNFLFCPGVEPVNSVGMISGWQQRDSVTHIRVSVLPQTPLPPRLPCNTEAELLVLSRRTLLVIHCKYSIVYAVIPHSLTIPSPVGPCSQG